MSDDLSPVGVYSFASIFGDASSIFDGASSMYLSPFFSSDDALPGFVYDADADAELESIAEVEYSFVVEKTSGSGFTLTALQDVPGGNDPFEFAMQSLPSQLVSFFRMVQDVDQAIDAAEMLDAPSGHPCGNELYAFCPEASETEAVISCLTSRLADLSPSCKCALHQLLGDSFEARGGSQRLAPPELRMVQSAPSYLLGEPHSHYMEDMHHMDHMEEEGHGHGHHGCAFMPLLWLGLAYISMHGVAACCRSRRRRAQMTVVLPTGPASLISSQAQISKGFEPLLVSQIRREYIDSIPAEAFPVAKV